MDVFSVLTSYLPLDIQFKPGATAYICTVYILFCIEEYSLLTKQCGHSFAGGKILEGLITRFFFLLRKANLLPVIYVGIVDYSSS